MVRRSGARALATTHQLRKTSLTAPLWTPRALMHPILPSISIGQLFLEHSFRAKHLPAEVTFTHEILPLLVLPLHRPSRDRV